MRRLAELLVEITEAADISRTHEVHAFVGRDRSTAAPHFY